MNDMNINKESNTIVLYKLLYYSEIMMDYLLETGKPIPEDIGKSLSELNLKAVGIIEEFKSKKGKLNPEQLWEMQIKIAEAIKDREAELTKIYSRLAELSRPATPKSIENTIPTERIFVKWGAKSIPFMRNLWMASLLCLVGYMVTGFFSATLEFTGPSRLQGVNANPNLEGVTFITQLFLLFSAGLGAYFYSLNTAKKYVIERTFDNKYITHYYNRIIIGVLAGLILANIVDISFLQKSAADNGGGFVTKFTPSLVALLGGYSAQAVVMILNRIVAMLTALVQGEVKDIIEAREQEIKNRYESERIKQNVKYAGELMEVLESSGVKNDEEVYKKVKGMIEGMMERK